MASRGLQPFGPKSSWCASWCDPSGGIEGSCTAYLMEIKKKNLAVFVSGSGTNFETIQESILKKNINGKIILLLSSKDGVMALEKAAKYKINSCVMMQNDYNNHEDYTNAMLKKLKEYKIDYIILAGYLKKMPLIIIQEYKLRIINIHPALLPKFGGKGMYGLHVHKAVLQAGEKETGPTVHFVDEIYDHGLIIMQIKVSVKYLDSPEELQKRVLVQEHIILPRVVRLLCDEKIKVEDNKVLIMEG